MSTSQFCETCLKLVVSVTACDIFWSRTTCSWASQVTKRAKNYSPLMTTLNNAIEICRGMVAASHNMKALKNEEVNKIKGISKKTSGQHKHWHRIKKPLQSVDQKAFKKKSLFCCQIKAMKKEMCPAWEKSCVACGERNHFKASNKCKLQSVNFLADDCSSDSSESSIETISTVTACEDQVVNSVDPGNKLIFLPNGNQ